MYETQTWKWGLETHLEICLNRGSCTLTNCVGSITSRISSSSPRNITYKHISESLMKQSGASLFTQGKHNSAEKIYREHRENSGWTIRNVCYYMEFSFTSFWLHVFGQNFNKPLITWKVPNPNETQRGGRDHERERERLWAGCHLQVLLAWDLFLGIAQYSRPAVRDRNVLKCVCLCVCVGLTTAAVENSYSPPPSA